MVAIAPSGLFEYDATSILAYFVNLHCIFSQGFSGWMGDQWTAGCHGSVSRTFLSSVYFARFSCPSTLTSLSRLLGYSIRLPPSLLNCRYCAGVNNLHYALGNPLCSRAWFLFPLRDPIQSWTLEFSPDLVVFALIYIVSYCPITCCL